MKVAVKASIFIFGWLPFLVFAQSSDFSVKSFQLNHVGFELEGFAFKDSTILLLTRTDAKLSVMELKLSGEVIAQKSADDLGAINLVARFFESRNGFDIIYAEMRGNILAYRLASFDHNGRLIKQVELPGNDYILEISKALYNDQYYYCKVLEQPSPGLRECQIYILEGDRPIFTKSFQASPAGRSPSFYFDVCAAGIILGSDLEYKPCFYAFRAKEAKTINNPVYVYSFYSEKELSMMPMQQAMLAKQFSHQYPPAIDNAFFVNDTVLAIIRFVRPGQKEVQIDLAKFNHPPAKTIFVKLCGDQFLYSFKKSNGLCLISKQMNSLCFQIVELCNSLCEKSK